MKATDRAYQNLETILTAHGLALVDGFSGKQIKGGEYVSYQVWDRHDSYEGGKEDFRAHGHIDVTASICRMGGEMTAEDFVKASAEMLVAATVLDMAGKADLSYTADINGEEV